MFRNTWFALVLAFFCAFVVPEKKAEAFIFRAAARVVGAVVGFSAAVVAGAARVVAGTAVLAARAVGAVAVGAFRVGRFLLFGRPYYARYYYGYGYRPYYASYYPNYGKYYYPKSYYPQYYYPQQTYYTPMGSTHTNTGDGWNNARSWNMTDSRENWCANQIPMTEYSDGNWAATCEIEWQGNTYSASGRNKSWAVTNAKREACKAGAKPEWLLTQDVKWCGRQL